MKEKLLALLVAKFAGVPETTLERIASKKAGSVSDEGQLQSIVDGIDYGQILQSEVDAKITDANKKAVSNYEKQHNLKDGKPVKVEDPKPAGDPNDVATIVANAVKAAVEPLQSKIETLEGAQTKDKLAVKVKAQLKEKGIPEKFVGDISVESEDDIESFVTAQETRFAEFKQEMINSGNYTESPSGGSGPTEKSVEDYQKLMDGDDKSEDAGKVDLGLSENN